jgi:Ion channel
MFHALAKECADTIAGTGPLRSDAAWLQVYRALEHGVVKNACKQASSKGFPAEIIKFAETFVTMQEERHTADYDPQSVYTRPEVIALVADATQGIALLSRAGVLAVHWHVGGFAGLPVETLQDCLYFSVVTYTSLGFGDHVPVSHARLIAGVEALNGLLLIGWSASFTYLAMERYWPMHERRRKGIQLSKPATTGTAINVRRFKHLVRAILK